MSEIQEYSRIASFTGVATDLVTYRQKPHEEWPELPRWKVIVSKADVDSRRSAGKTKIPTRNEKGERHSEVYNRLPAGFSKRYAERNGWPFVVHINNLDGAEIV